ncbi:MAG: DUF429 domain-containing protein [Rhodothermales bacterium]|nr:DUF429 domain-containing protein [Rhodothermales bacterium]
MSSAPSVWVAGTDGCRAGWFVVLHEPATGRTRCRTVPAFHDLLALPERPRVLAVDIPIGLPERGAPGGRACDRAARRLLGRPRASSVFAPPARLALRGRTHAEAQAVQRATAPDAPGLTVQAFNLFPKLREVDAAMTPALQGRVREAHPELTFRALNGGEAVAAPKRRAEGRRLRLALLERAGFEEVAEAVEAHRGLGVARDDVADAFACCWTAGRIARGEAERLPERPPTDARGLRMEIWY